MNLLKIIKFDLSNDFKNMSFIFAYLITPIILLAGISFLTQSYYDSSLFSSIDYYGITMSVFLCSMMCDLSLNSFTVDTVKPVNIRVIYSPTKKTNIFLSKILSGFIYGIIMLLIFTLFEHFILNVNLGGANVFFVLAINIAFIFFSCTLGCLLGCVIHNGNIASKTSSFLFSIFAALGGVFFPVYEFGKTFSKFSHLSPETPVIKCIFSIIYDNDLSSFLGVISFLIIASIILIILCKITFKPEEYI